MIDWKHLGDLPRRARPEKGEPLARRGGTGGSTKRRQRRNRKMRDALKQAGRHRGFSHGKA